VAAPSSKTSVASLLVLVGVHAMVFKPTVYDHPEELDKSPVLPTRAKAAAVLSLILWVSIPVLRAAHRVLRT